MGDRVVLVRPWWARILGPHPGTAMLVLIFGPISVFAPAVAVDGDLKAAGGLLLSGLFAAAVVAIGQRVGVTVDDDGITVQNMILRHRIPWTGIVRLDLIGGGGAARTPMRTSSGVPVGSADRWRSAPWATSGGPAG